MESVAELKNIGKYALQEEVGHGEVGTVFRASDPASGSQVAIKKLLPEVAAAPGIVPRFTDAALAAIKLHHLNIVVAYDIGEDDGIPYVVTEFLQGLPLDQYAAAHPEFTPVQMIGMFVQVSDALHYAHEQGIIHGGLKPANVFILPDGSVKLTDFGLAIGSLNPSVAGEPSRCGRSDYLSPEQISGEATDLRTDVFSSGAMLYQLLTENLPFSAGERVRANGTARGGPLPLSRYLQSYPAQLDHIMERALAERPQSRYSNAAEMAADLSAARDAFKQILVDGYLEYARACIANSEIETAREVLDSLREIDDQLPEIKELSAELHRHQDSQSAPSAVATAREQAEYAPTEEQRSEGDPLVDQSLQLEGNHAALSSQGTEIENVDSEPQTVRQLLDHVESVESTVTIQPEEVVSASAFHDIPKSLSIGILSGPASASAPYARPTTLGMGRHEESPIEPTSQDRLKRALLDPRFLVAIAAVVLLVLGFGIAASVRSKHKPQPLVVSSQPSPAANLSAAPYTGSPQDLAARSSSANPGGTATATPPAPPPPVAAPIGPGLVATTDLDCDWKIDGKPQDRMKQGEQAQVSIPAGKHRVLATSLDGLDQWKIDIAVGKTEQKTVQIKLAAVVQKRLDKLQAEQKRLADAEEERKKQAEADAEKLRLATAAEEAEAKRKAEVEALAEKNRQAEAEKKRSADAEAAQKRAEDEQNRLAALQQSLWPDPATGLWWAKRDNGADVNFRQAQSYCASLSLAGHSQWRLPTIEELQGIYNPGGKGTNRVRGGLQTSGGYSYWSNSREGSGQAWTFNFGGTRYPNQLEYHTTTRALCVHKSE